MEKQVFWRIHDYSCMLKLARLESVRVPLSGKRPTNMAQEYLQTPPCSTSVGSIIRGGHPRLTSGPLGKRGVWDHCLRWDSNKNVSQRQTNTQTARNWSSFVKSSPAPSCEGIKKRWSYFTIVCRGAKQEKRRTFRCGYYLII